MSRKETYVSLRTAVFFYLACFYNALATSLLCSPMPRASKAFPSLSFFQVVFTNATYLFSFTQPIISKVPKEKANRKLQAGKLIYWAVAVTSTKAITTNLQFCTVASIERFKTKSLLVLTETGMFTLKTHREMKPTNIREFPISETLE